MVAGLGSVVGWVWLSGVETAMFSVGLVGEAVGSECAAGVLAVVCVTVVSGLGVCRVVVTAVVDVVEGWMEFGFRESICWLVL